MSKTRFLIPLFFIVLSVILFLPADVSAAEDDGLECIDVLAYDYPDDSNSVMIRVNSSKPYNVFDLPFSFGLVFFDVIIHVPTTVNSAGMRSVSSGTFYPLTLASLGDGYYRVYGQTSTPFNSQSFAFQINTSVNAFTVTYYKFNVYTVTNVGTGDLGEMNVTPNADTSVSPNYWYRQPTPGYSIVQDFYYYSTAKNYLDYSVLFSSVNWRKYDYLDFEFIIDASTVSTISSFIETDDGLVRYIPFDITYLNGDAIDKNEFIGSGSTTVIPASSRYHVLMRVYIPSSFRLSGSFFIQVDGQYVQPASRAYLKSVVGYYYTTVPSPDATKLDQIAAAIRESLSSSPEDNAAAEQFANDMTQKKEQITSKQDAINSVDRPSSDGLGSLTSPDSVLDSSGMSSLTAMISPVSNNRIVLSILTLSATLALVSYVFFGKKR